MRIRWWWRNWVRRSRTDRDLDAELRSTIELIAEEKIARGVLPEDAKRAALVELGGLESVKEQVRSARAGAAMEDVARDVRYAVRMLRRNPGFTTAAVLTLALGVGANTAIFSVVDAVLLKSLPVDSPSELVVIEQTTSRGQARSVSYPLFERLRSDSELVGAPRGVLSGLTAVVDGTHRVSVAPQGSPGVASEATAQLVGGEYFSILGVRPFVGRLLTRADDDRLGDPQVVVLSHRFWRTRFADDPAVLESTILVKGYPMRIVGVAAQAFFGESVGRAPDMWMPLSMQPRFDGQSYLDAANVGWLQLIGRIRRDRADASSYDQINAALTVVRSQSDTTPVGQYVKGMTLRASDGRRGLDGFRVRFALPLQILTAIVGVVLLIACANVSNLFLVRALGRRREMGIRLAIGAGRARVIRQLVTESFVFAGMAGAIGLMIGAWGSHVLLMLASAEAAPGSAGPVPIAVALDSRVLFFTAAISLLTVVIVGLAPAVMVSNVDVSTSLKKADEGVPRTRLAPVLVVAQVALSMMLVTSAGLFVQTLNNVRFRDVGFAPDRLLELSVRSTSPLQSPEQVADLTRRVRERLQAAAGVVAVSFAHAGFGGGISRTCCIAVEGYTHQDGEQREVRMLGVGPDYFKTMGLAVKEGRDFARDEAVVDPNRLTVAIVNEAFVRRYLGGRTVGTRFGWGDPPRVRYGLEIVGVVGDAVYDNLRETTAPLLFFPSASGDTFVLRTAGAPEALAPLVRHEAGAVDQSLEVQTRAVSSILDAAVARERLLSRLSGFFGVVALLLAAIGLYGLLAFGVARRTKEIGIRIALGANRRLLLRSQLRAAIGLTAIGIACGIPLTTLAGRLIGSQLFGIVPMDPATLVSAAIVLTTIAGASALLPALRASRIDPIAALRSE